MKERALVERVIKKPFLNTIQSIWKSLPIHLIFVLLLMAFSTQARAEDNSQPNQLTNEVTKASIEPTQENKIETEEKVEEKLPESDSNEPSESGSEVEKEVAVAQSANDQCRSQLINDDFNQRYTKLKKSFENDYNQGLPHQLKKDLIRVREDIDQLSSKLFDVNNSDPQEVNHIVQLAIDHLEKMITLLPKANNIAPIVRDRYVVPFTNINSIKAEQQECLMKLAVEEVQEKSPASMPESSGNIYQRLTSELEELNRNLYTIQTSDVQKFISYRAELLRLLEKFNKNPQSGVAATAPIPNMINKVHIEIEKLLPGLELSEKYYSIMQ